MLGALVASIVQMFFCYRIWIMKKQGWILPVVVFISMVSLVALVGGLMAGIQVYRAGTDIKAQHYKTDLYLWLIGSAVADLLIALILVTILLMTRNSDHPWTNSILMRLVRMIMETNLLTAGMAILTVSLFFAYPEEQYFTCPSLFIGKLYSNSLVATLNYRVILGTTKQPSFPNSDIRFNGNRNSTTEQSFALSSRTFAASRNKGDDSIQMKSDLDAYV
ncbi:hypothetical protein H0H92_013625 [Tricholoma furcatifolium]|nr:hypothetical protein H0H92_013625 [Tricholoma furcatifolium]